jgi:hypothetical protein
MARLLIDRGQVAEAGRLLTLAAAAGWQHVFDRMEDSMVSHDDIAAYLAKPAALAAQAGKLIEYLRAYQQAGGSLDPYLLALLADQLAQVSSREGAIEAVHLALSSLPHWKLKPDTHLAMLAFAARALARAGALEEAGKLVLQAQHDNRQEAVVGAELWLAPAMALLGDFDQARQVTLANLQYQESHEALLTLADALARHGHIEQALTLTDHCEDDEKIDELLEQIARALAENGKDELAAEIADRMIYGDRYAKAMRGLSSIQARAGRLSAALRSIRLLDRAQRKEPLPLTLSEQIQKVPRGIRANVPEQQATQLRLIASLLQQHQEQAAQVLASAEVESFTASRDERLRTAATRLSAQAAAARGDLDRALSIYEAMPSSIDRLAVLVVLVHALVAMEDVAAARALVDQAQDLTPEGRAMLGAELAQALHAAQREPEAHLEMQWALRLLERLPAEQEAVLALCAAARQLAGLERQEPAFALLALGTQICEKLQQVIPYVRSAASLSQAYMQIGSPQPARELIGQASLVQVSDYSTQAAALRHLLPAAAALKDLSYTLRLAGATLQVVQRLDEPLERAETLAVVVRCLAENGLFEDALGLASKVDNPLYFLQAVGELLEQLNSQSNRTLADQTAKAAWQQMQQGTEMWQYHGKQLHLIEDDIVQQLKGYAENWRKEALVYNHLARGFQQTGFPDQAMQAFDKAGQMADKIHRKAEGAAVLAELAETATMLGQRAAAGELAERAAELARKAEDWETYALGLSSAAQAYLCAGEAGKAQELTLEAWQALARFSLASRASVYEVLGRSAEVLAAIDKGDTMEGVGKSMAEVEEWWLE